jgi:hypothetical protein
MADDKGATVYAANMVLENTAIDTTDTYYGLRLIHTKTAGNTTSADDLFGVHSVSLYNDNDESFGALYGAYFKAHCNGAHTGQESGDIVGAFGIGEMTSADIDNIYGGRSQCDINGGTVDSIAYGHKIDVDIESGATLSDHVTPLAIVCDADTNPSGNVYGVHLLTYSNQDAAWTHYDAENTAYRTTMSNVGVIEADGAINANAWDYAEYFESKDGSPIAVGVSVKLDGDKIVPASDGDNILGVIRPPNTSTVVGNCAWNNWSEKFMKDDYGAHIWENFTKTKWEIEISLDEYKKRGKDETGGSMGGRVIDFKKDEDGKYYRKYSFHSDRIPKDLTVPDDAKIITPSNKRQKINPSYDDSKKYETREERDEWHIVGLLGQIPVTKGQPVASNWIKMKDVSDTVEMYFVK